MLDKKSKIDQYNNDDFELDLLSLLKLVFQKRKIVFLNVSIFFFLGLSISFLQPSAQYKSETTFLLKSSSESFGGLGSFGSLAAIAGINLPSNGLSSGLEINPSLYPKFISSIEFKKALIQAPIMVDGEKEPVTYAKYFEKIAKPTRLEVFKKYTLGLPTFLISKINSNVFIDTTKKEDFNLLRITPNEELHFARLENQLKVESMDGIMKLSFSMPEPLLAAKMAEFAFQLLQKEIINYKIGNLQEELRFSEELYVKKKKEFEKIQNELSFFNDKNQNLVSSSIQNKIQQLQTEYNLKLAVFTQLASALEATKLQIARDTPIFSILDPVTIPSSPEPNNRFLIILFFIILGLVVSLVYIIVEPYLKIIKKKWNHS